MEKLIKRKEETTMASIKKAILSLGSTVSPTIDMSVFYLYLGLNPDFDSLKCPTLICGVNLPGNCDYIRTVLDNHHDLIYTRKGLPNEDVLKIISGRTKDYIGTVQKWPVELPCPYITKYDISTFYLLGSLLAKSMNVRCPHIFVKNTPVGLAKGMKGMAFNTPGTYAKTTHIEIYENPRYHEIDLFETLAHEMRHCWQHEKYPSKFFSSYKFYTEYKNEREEEYFLQPAELDARAYALRFLRAATGHDYPSNLTYPKVNQIIEKYAKTLDASLFEPVKGLFIG